MDSKYRENMFMETNYCSEVNMFAALIMASAKHDGGFFQM